MSPRQQLLGARPSAGQPLLQASLGRVRGGSNASALRCTRLGACLRRGGPGSAGAAAARSVACGRQTCQPPSRPSSSSRRTTAPAAFAAPAEEAAAPAEEAASEAGSRASSAPLPAPAETPADAAAPAVPAGAEASSPATPSPAGTSTSTAAASPSPSTTIKVSKASEPKKVAGFILHQLATAGPHAVAVSAIGHGACTQAHRALVIASSLLGPDQVLQYQPERCRVPVTSGEGNVDSVEGLRFLVYAAPASPPSPAVPASQWVRVRANRDPEEAARAVASSMSAPPAVVSAAGDGVHQAQLIMSAARLLCIQRRQQDFRVTPSMERLQLPQEDPTAAQGTSEPAEPRTFTCSIFHLTPCAPRKGALQRLPRMMRQATSDNAAHSSSSSTTTTSSSSSGGSSNSNSNSNSADNTTTTTITSSSSSSPGGHSQGTADAHVYISKAEYEDMQAQLAALPAMTEQLQLMTQQHKQLLRLLAAQPAPPQPGLPDGEEAVQDDQGAQVA